MPSDPLGQDPPPLPEFPPEFPTAQPTTQSLRTVSTRRHRTSSDADSTDSRERSRRVSKHSEVYEDTIRAIAQLRTQLDYERQRANDAESKLQEVTAHLKSINDARIQAMHDAAQAKEELNVYKIQLETAQKEIYRAQDVIQIVDRQRYQAEQEAAKNRTKARQLNETIMVQLARDEAYKIGLQEGLQRGRHLTLGDDPDTPYEPREPQRGRPDMLGFDDDFSSEGSRPASALEPEPEPVPQRIPEPQPANPVRPHSVAPSIRSNASVIRPRGSPLPVPSPLPSRPPTHVPSAPPSVAGSEQIRPVSLRNTTPTPRFSHHLPPDNYIPTLGADNRIGLPPPHEFVRTPERPASPQLPVLSDSSQEPIPIPAPGSANTPHHRKRQHRRHSSSGSNSSSSLSHLDILNFATTARTPMSVIQECTRNHSTRTANDHDLEQAMLVRPDKYQPMHEANVLIQEQATQAPPGTLINPNEIQPALHQKYPNATTASPGGSYRAPLPTLDEMPDQYSHHEGEGMPGGYGGGIYAESDPYSAGPSTGTAGPTANSHSHGHLKSKGKSKSRRHSSHHQHHGANGYDDDDAVSSAFSEDTLTTLPPTIYRPVEGGPPPDWSSVLDQLDHPPIGMYTITGHDPLPHGSNSTTLWSIPDARK
ncbi:unnamed protein product [Cyclocybe aegerita]|uniref:Uncharacterized protein n=1 Tax=Cyclocybe aegerita TaxID=1973307 RepID=A0A8S0XK85_CYCAE|nr:unnamed protein product [Cyclocybe aegerita]